MEKRYLALSRGEIEKVLKTDPRELSCAFLQIQLMTGMRTSEMLGLCWSDIYFDRKRISVKHQLKGGNTLTLIGSTKNFRARCITVPSVVLDILEIHKSSTASSHGRIFADKNGGSLDRRMLLSLLRSTIGRNDARLHDLRVTCATVMYELTHDIFLVSEYLGHSSVAVTEKHYISVTHDLTAVAEAENKYYAALLQEK